MILVDTTVWVDFFAGRTAPHVALLEAKILNEEDLCICGLILTEVLQGIRNDKQYNKTKLYFASLIYLPMTNPTFVLAADIYRDLRQRGVTVRKSVDCLIASVALEQNALLLHNDRDFEPIQKYHGLRVI